MVLPQYKTQYHGNTSALGPSEEQEGHPSRWVIRLGESFQG
jgi:hypothetical protein